MSFISSLLSVLTRPVAILLMLLAFVVFVVAACLDLGQEAQLNLKGKSIYTHPIN